MSGQATAERYGNAEEAACEIKILGLKVLYLEHIICGLRVRVERWEDRAEAAHLRAGASQATDRNRRLTRRGND